MAIYYGLNSQNYSSLFTSSFRASKSSSGTSLYHSLGDYGMIQNCGYTKLCKAYYAKEAENSKTDTKTDTEVAEEAVSLKKKASTLANMDYTEENKSKIASGVKDFVDSFLGGNGFMGKMDNRMYGIGCALDVAGLKFSCVLVAISFVVMNGLCKSNLRTYVYWIAYLFVAVVGNMIGRTTSVGVVVSVFYMIVHCLYNGDSGYLKSRIFPLVLMITVLLPILVFLYNNNPQTRDDLRFGFEGFFSLAETGKWETNSNNRLQGMFILPDNPKTWIIGDGYFDNPYTDPYYNGDNPTEYYKGTDVGYLRFIYYFGIIGLISFVVFFFEAFWNCASRHRQYAMLFLMLLLVNYIVWIKVSSDIFLIFAFFLCVPAESEEGSEQNVMEK